MTQKPFTPPESLRAMLAEAMRAYELAAAKRLQAESEAKNDNQEQLKALKKKKQAAVNAAEVKQKRAADDAGAKQERIGQLLSSIDGVESSARELLEKAGLAHIAGAPLRLVENTARSSQPDKAVAAAFAGAQTAFVDLRTALLELAQAYANAEDWEQARQVAGPLLENKDGPLYSSAYDLMCTILYHMAVLASSRKDWNSAKQMFEDVLARKPQFQDTVAQLHQVNITLARQAIEAGEYQEALQDLQNMTQSGIEDKVVQDLLCETHYALAGQALESKDWNTAASYVGNLKQLNSTYRDISEWYERYPMMNWCGSLSAPKELSLNDSINCITLSQSGKFLAAGGLYRPDIRVWNLITGQILFEQQNESMSEIDSLVFSPNDKFIAVGEGGSWIVQVWNLVTGKAEHSFNLEHVNQIEGLAFNADGQMLICGGEDGVIRLWDLNTGHLLVEYNEGSQISTLVFSDRANVIAAGTYDGNVSIWDVKTGLRIRSLQVSSDDGVVFHIRFLGDGNILASAQNLTSACMVTKEWELENGTLIRSMENKLESKLKYENHKLVRIAITSSCNGEMLAIGQGNEIKVIDGSSGQDICSLSGHERRVTGLVFAPDNSFLISGSEDGSLKIWRPTASGEMK